MSPIIRNQQKYELYQTVYYKISSGVTLGESLDFIIIDVTLNI